MSDAWTYAQTDGDDELAKLHFFSMKKRQPAGDVEFTITVREYVQNPEDQSMRFFAQADKETNQKAAPFRPSGWGGTLLKALSECVREIHRFPYEPPEAG
ncbi:MAG TPA: hypothetical protein VEK15_23095 [Vicinamibacteria bacterium]|nr:hypothetical protein [Vicinamibacteria bacterium]